MKQALLAFALLVLLAAVAVPREPRTDQRTRVYNEISDDRGLDRAARSIYSAKYEVIDVKAGPAFIPARVKGHGWVHRDPRPIREVGTRAKAVLFYIVTPEGMVVEPRVGTSTDNRVANYLLKLMATKRFFPARLNGVPVFSIASETAEFEASRPEENTLFKNGLGIQGSRDR